MVIPDTSSATKSLNDAGLSSQGERSSPRLEQDTAGKEIDEVRKLQELVRKLEIQNAELIERQNNPYYRPQLFNGNTFYPLSSDGPKICLSTPEKNLDRRIFMDSEHDRLDNRDDLTPSLKSSTNKLVEQGGQFQLEAFDSVLAWKNECEGTLVQNCQEKNWKTELEEMQSALDLVELLDVEKCTTIENEDNWLYESPKKEAIVDDNLESPLKWSRKVLDNPSPETDVACRTLINMLEQNARLRNLFSSSPYRHPTAYPVTHYMGSPYRGYKNSRDKLDQTPYSPGKDQSEPCESEDFITMGYRLQDLTDVQIMARMQEESLRQDYASIPASPLSSTVNQSPRSILQTGHHITQLPRASHQVAQSKLLKLAQSRVVLRNSMPNLDSPRTSLRSLQAVRNSRSMEDNTQHPSDHTASMTYSVTARSHSGAVLGNTFRSASVSTKTMTASVPVAGAQQSLRESVHAASIRGLQRAQSLSPSNIRIRCPGKELSVKGYLASHSRVHASPERSTTLAWGRIGQPARR